MTIHVDSNWWKNAFDEIYLMTDARSVCNKKLTLQEVDFLINTLKLGKSDPILDLCGGHGRHSLELSRRGFKNVTALDYSRYLIDLGKNIAKKEALNTVFIEGDARKTGLQDDSFKFIIIMASSFGYFIKKEENSKILNEAYRLLKPKGTLLLDLPNRDYLLQNFKPISTHQASEDVTVYRERELKDDMLHCRERVASKSGGLLRDMTYCVNLYSPEKISGILRTTRFSSIICTKDFANREAEGEYGCMTNRMVVTARK